MRGFTWFVILWLVSPCLSDFSPFISDHPRLFLLDEDIPTVLQVIAQDGVSLCTLLHCLQAWYKNLIERAEALVLNNQTVVWNPGRIIDTSRTVLDRVGTLAGIYRLTNNTAYADRAILEMKAAASFPGWDPQAFLDTSEMMNALAIGYDWLYNYMSDGDKEEIENAIFNLGFHYAIEFYNGNFTKDPELAHCFNWAIVPNNWNLVCNGGTTVAAIALWEVFPNETQSSMSSVGYALQSYAPDGGWLEGPTYWGYATRYFSYQLGAMESAFGSDLGILVNYSYFANTGYFHVYTLSNAFYNFNYADCSIAGELNWNLGSFTIEKSRIPFAYDLGPDNYSLPDYFEIPQRYQYYRTNTTGHNTLSFNGNNNQAITTALVSEYSVTDDSMFVQVDLSHAYKANATSVTRSLSYNMTTSEIVVNDLIVPNGNTKSVTWRIHSYANMTISGQTALLQYSTLQLSATILSPPEAVWETHIVQLSAPYLPASIKVLQFEIPVTESVNLTVQFS